MTSSVGTRLRLHELAYACRLYGPLTSADRGLRELRSVTAGLLDPHDGTHREALFVWLNSWGCRQFAKEHHATTASESLISWAEEWLDRLPSLDIDLSNAASTDHALLGDAYEDLRFRTASLRHVAARESHVTYGPVGAAKTLFALRPRLFAPWDNPIINMLKYWPARGPDYARYLSDIRLLLEQLSANSGTPIAEIPALIGRPDSSPVKLIDEYNWVKITRGFEAPTIGQLHEWLAWAEQGS